jgi:hypothetical protein
MTETNPECLMVGLLWAARDGMGVARHLPFSLSQGVPVPQLPGPAAVDTCRESCRMRAHGPDGPIIIIVTMPCTLQNVTDGPGAGGSHSRFAASAWICCCPRR